MKLFKNFNKYNDRIALISEITGDITYSQIDTYTKKIKDYIEKRSLVLIISQNTVGSIVSYISCIRNNFVVILVSDLHFSLVLEFNVFLIDLSYVVVILVYVLFFSV